MALAPVHAAVVDARLERLAVDSELVGFLKLGRSLRSERRPDSRPQPVSVASTADTQALELTTNPGERALIEERLAGVGSARGR